MTTFEKLEKYPPQLQRLPDDVGSTFWEDLYKLFKQRMEHEIRMGQFDVEVMKEANQ